eukprot:jgi/Mesvir1/16292/Mv13025-RA.1
MAPLTSSYGFACRLLFAAIVLGCLMEASRVLDDWTRPELLLVGLVTDDLVDGQHVPGGAISYAAAVASAHGITAHVVTLAAPGTNLSIFDGHHLHVVPADKTLTFEHTYTWWGNKRKLSVPARPNATLALQHVPASWRRAKTLLLGTLLLGEMDVPSLLAVGAERIGLIAQGLQRDLDDSGRVVHLAQPSPSLMAALDPRVTVFLSDVEADPWPRGTLEGLLPKVARVVVTRGEQGADILAANRTTLHIPPRPVKAVDTNGAGDVFATSFMLASDKTDNGKRHSRLATLRGLLGGGVKGSLNPILNNEEAGPESKANQAELELGGVWAALRGLCLGGKGSLDEEAGPERRVEQAARWERDGVLAGQAAAVAASFAVSKPQSCKPFCTMDGYRPLSTREDNNGTARSNSTDRERSADHGPDWWGGAPEGGHDLRVVLDAYLRLWTLGTRWLKDAALGLVGGPVWPETNK